MRSDAIARGVAAVLLAAGTAAPGASLAAADATRVHLEISPRVCTLEEPRQTCDTTVVAQWRSTQKESLCLLVADLPEVRQCWEDYTAGVYSAKLSFAGDLTFELRDPLLKEVLATEVLRVIRQAAHYRPKRRQPWNVFG